MTDDHPKSPCISVCALNSGNICTGCYRSSMEITDWSMANAAQKQDILHRAHQRRLAAAEVRLS